MPPLPAGEGWGEGDTLDGENNSAFTQILNLVQDDDELANYAFSKFTVTFEPPSRSSESDAATP